MNLIANNEGTKKLCILTPPPSWGAPEYAESYEKLVADGDTSKLYLLPDGYIYVYTTSEVKETITHQDNIVGTTDNPFYDNARLSGSGGDTVETDVTNYFVTPLIDLTPYSDKHIILHLEGAQFFGTTALSYTQTRLLGANKAILAQRDLSIIGDAAAGHVWAAVSDATVSIVDTNKSQIEMDVPPKFSSAATPIWYMRFGAAGKSVDVNIFITYETVETSTKVQWTNTGIKYGSGVESNLSSKVAALNNEGSDAETIELLPAAVKSFIDKPDYSSDYTTSYLSKISYPYRADIPVPYTVKWEYNESAMRTIISLDTKAISTDNFYTMLSYDATGMNKYPLYNLLPGATYYYKVSHVMSDGSIIDAKSGIFTTSSTSLRLLYIDGTQNVRDLGGWTNLEGKKVKYGKIIRGGALSDSSYPELIITGKGRRALGELDIQAELNLGAVDTETSIASNCAYKKVGYSNYADAITNATARAQFKEILEWIVSCLDGQLVQGSLPVVQRNIYIHCQGGCDRTGTLSFLLLGLLGISESDLAKEYELSSFSSVGMGRLRNTVKATDTYDYSGMVSAIKNYSGSTLADKIMNFATESETATLPGCGISSATINKFIDYMLE